MLLIRHKFNMEQKRNPRSLEPSSVFSYQSLNNHPKVSIYCKLFRPKKNHLIYHMNIFFWMTYGKFLIFYVKLSGINNGGKKYFWHCWWAGLLDFYHCTKWSSHLNIYLITDFFLILYFLYIHKRLLPHSTIMPVEYDPISV